MAIPKAAEVCELVVDQRRWRVRHADKADQFKNCLTSAWTSDKIYTSEGRTKFVNESLPNCVDKASA